MTSPLKTRVFANRSAYILEQLSAPSGVLSNAFFTLQSEVFGGGHDFATLLCKVAVDKCVWSALLCVPLNSLFFFWEGRDFSFARCRLDIGTTKTTSGLLLLSRERVFQYASGPCINCGRCVRACPMNLNPAEISKAVESDDVKSAEDAHVMTCIECGACSFGCPAYRQITQLCRRAKASIRARIAAEKAKAAAAAEKEKLKAQPVLPEGATRESK